ncbi:Uncharacterised protein [Vibrio cholerae]|nr:Uncharacterised protein [Vibrio cholerae]
MVMAIHALRRMGRQWLSMGVGCRLLGAYLWIC